MTLDFITITRIELGKVTLDFISNIIGTNNRVARLRRKGQYSSWLIPSSGSEKNSDCMTLKTLTGNLSCQC